MLDATGELDPDDIRTVASDKKRILVLNKIDLNPTAAMPEIGASIQKISCHTGEGISELKDAIRNAVWAGGVGGEMQQVMINSRHQEALQRARTHTVHTIEALRSGHTLELAAMDLRIATNAIGEIVGKTTTEDILDSIFSQFCIGK